MPVATDGSLYAVDPGPGATYADMLSRPPFAGGDTSSAVSVQPATNNRDTGASINYIPYIIGIVIMLAVLKWASEHEKSGMEPEIVGIGVYNFAVVGIMAQFWFLITKIAVNKTTKLPGLTNIVNTA